MSSLYLKPIYFKLTIYLTQIISNTVPSSQHYLNTLQTFQRSVCYYNAALSIMKRTQSIKIYNFKVNIYADAAGTLPPVFQQGAPIICQELTAAVSKKRS